MKNKIILVVSALLLITFFSSCGVGKRATIEGVDSNAYLHFVLSERTLEIPEWSIIVDDGVDTAITADRNIESYSKDNLYEIPSGSHTLKIFRNKKLIQTKKIFVGARETKTIKL